MESHSLETHQHLQLTKQIKKEPVKEASNLLSNSSSVSWDDLRGLSWIFLEEDIQ